MADLRKHKGGIFKKQKNIGKCTAIGNLDHCLSQDYDTITLRLKGAIRWQNGGRFTPQFKAEVVIEVLTGQSSQADCVENITSVADQLSKWKHQLIQNAATLFESTDKPSDDSTERIAQLEQLVGRLTLALDIQKKASTWLT